MLTNIEEYHSFLDKKKIVFRSSGFEVSRDEIHPSLFEFQKDLVVWALRKGRAAIFADTGLGKTRMQLEFARIINLRTGLPVIIVAPLSIAKQTVKEAKNLGLDILFSRSDKNIASITITNYEMLKDFNPEHFGGMVLDESSILKSLDGKTKKFLIETFSIIPYRLCCTATPSPNDIIEIGGHSEYLGVMTETYMKANFFIHDSEVGNNQWRLRKHSVDHFYRWLASWGMSLRKPSDLGYSDEGYNLPPLNIKPIFIESPDNQAFFHELKGITHRSKVRRDTIQEKADKLAELVNNSDEQWIVWCGLNDEAEIARKILNDNVEVKGSDSIDKKIKAIEDFQEGKVKVFITKPKIGGMGLNLQNSHNMVFFGLFDSFETYYQCIRRQYRFGQTHPVNVFILLSELERAIYDNVIKKEAQAKEMSRQLIEHVQQYELQEMEKSKGEKEFIYSTRDETGELKDLTWKLMLGDSVERIKEIPDNSVDFSVYSPPFQDLYCYSGTERDIGNSSQLDQFLEHLGYIISELLRITKPGRTTAVHIADAQATLVRDGYRGLKPLSDEVGMEYRKRGWLYQARITIEKDPQVAAIRTRAKELAFAQIERDQNDLAPAMPDYIFKFTKPGENEVVVNRGLTNEEWIRWANPVWDAEGDRTKNYGYYLPWHDIRASDTLQGWQNAKGPDDERHICPLQLPTIERCIKLWSNPGELVFSPFAGIGSEIYMALKLGRNGLGIELNPRYFSEAVKNMKKLEIVEETLF
jgi:DNA modification methylase